jgi:hypothetical protein
MMASSPGGALLKVDLRILPAGRLDLLKNLLIRKIFSIMQQEITKHTDSPTQTDYAVLDGQTGQNRSDLMFICPGSSAPSPPPI